jgi:hypothetical protein
MNSKLFIPFFFIQPCLMTCTSIFSSTVAAMSCFNSFLSCKFSKQFLFYFFFRDKNNKKTRQFTATSNWLNCFVWFCTKSDGITSSLSTTPMQ